MDELRRAHKKKKKKHSRHSSSSSDSSSDSDSSVERKKSRTEHKRKGETEHKTHRVDEKRHRRDQSRDRSRHEREHRRRDASPEAGGERSRHTREDRGRDQAQRHHRDKGERWEDEEKRYDRRPTGTRVKQEPESDPEDRRGPRPGGHREFRGGRGRGFRGRGGRGGNGIPWGRGGRGEEEQFEWGRPGEQQREEKPKVDKEKPNFGLSGKLTEDVNTINGVVIKYSEPPESRKPKRRWRLYVFKGEEVMPTLYIHRQSAYLMGRDRKIADIPLDHPSISKQHAALQYRLVTFKKDDGLSTGKCIRPYIIDLESANGTYVNNKKIEAKKYVQLMEKDVLKFGYSSREYVLLHEHSQDTNSGDDDDVKEEGPNPVCGNPRLGEIRSTKVASDMIEKENFTSYHVKTTKTITTNVSSTSGITTNCHHNEKN